MNLRQLPIPFWSPCNLCDNQFRQYVTGQPAHTMCRNCKTIRRRLALHEAALHQVRTGIDLPKNCTYCGSTNANRIHYAHCNRPRTASSTTIKEHPHA